MNSVTCRVCKEPLKHVFVDLGMSPLANSYLTTAQLEKGEVFYPLRPYVCHKCLLVQLPEFESPEEIFSDYAYLSSYSDAFLAHAESYVDMAVHRFGLNPKSRVVELASNDGYLLQYFVRKGVPVLGVEPAANVAKVAVSKGVPTVCKFFGVATADEFCREGQQADLIVANNVLAHVPDLNDFVRGMKVLLRVGGVITVEVPHLMKLMAHNQFDTIYHEHFSYFSLFVVEDVFMRNGLKVFDVEEIWTHGGSLRVFACHAEESAQVSSQRLLQLRAREKAEGFDALSHYLDFGKRVAEVKRKLLSFLIEASRAGKQVVGYGAPAKAITLLNYCGVRSDCLEYTVDRSPYKQGHYLPGVRVPIVAPDQIARTRPDYVLIFAWNLREEIMQQMAFIREWRGQFVVPIPEVKVYE